MTKDSPHLPLRGPHIHYGLLPLHVITITTVSLKAATDPLAILGMIAIEGIGYLSSKVGDPMFQAIQ